MEDGVQGRACVSKVASFQRDGEEQTSQGSVFGVHGQARKRRGIYSPVNTQSAKTEVQFFGFRNRPSSRCEPAPPDLKQDSR
jgi:hypothetical protein